MQYDILKRREKTNRTLAECHKFYPDSGYLIEYNSTNRDEYNLSKNSSPALLMINLFHSNRLIIGFYIIQDNKHYMYIYIKKQFVQ